MRPGEKERPTGKRPSKPPVKIMGKTLRKKEVEKYVREIIEEKDLKEEIQLHAELVFLKEDHAAAISLLRKLEWGGNSYGEFDPYMCRICGGLETTDGHTPDCKLSELIG